MCELCAPFLSLTASDLETCYAQRRNGNGDMLARIVHIVNLKKKGYCFKVRGERVRVDDVVDISEGVAPQFQQPRCRTQTCCAVVQAPATP